MAGWWARDRVCALPSSQNEYYLDVEKNKQQFYVQQTTLHSNREPVFGKGAYTVQNSPTTVNNLTIPLCTHPSTLNRKKCAVQVHLTEKGG